MPQPAEWQAIGEDPEKFAALVKAANRQGIKIRRDREHLLLICYGKSLDTLRTELQDSMPPVSLDPYGAGAPSFCLLVPNLTNPVFVTHLLRKSLDTLRNELHDSARSHTPLWR